MGVTVRLQLGEDHYISIQAVLHNGTKRNASTHNSYKFDRLPKTSDGSIVIAL